MNYKYRMPDKHDCLSWVNDQVRTHEELREIYEAVYVAMSRFYQKKAV